MLQDSCYFCTARVFVGGHFQVCIALGFQRWSHPSFYWPAGSWYPFSSPDLSSLRGPTCLILSLPSARGPAGQVFLLGFVPTAAACKRLFPLLVSVSQHRTFLRFCLGVHDLPSDALCGRRPSVPWLFVLWMGVISLWLVLNSILFSSARLFSLLDIPVSMG